MNLVTERPILFSPMMVEALMSGKKLVTRRELKGLTDEPDAFSNPRIVINPEVVNMDEDEEDDSYKYIFY